MFSKTNKKGAAIHTPPAPPAPPSIISRDLNIVGDLLSEGEIQIDGGVNGDIRARVLIIGETANVKGEIVADTIRIHGSVEGQIKAKVVKLAQSAHVVGDILHEDLSIETGAFLEGHCKRLALSDDLHKVEGAGPGKSAKPANGSSPHGAVDAIADKAGAKPQPVAAK